MSNDKRHSHHDWNCEMATWLLGPAPCSQNWVSCQNPLSESWNKRSFLPRIVEHRTDQNWSDIYLFSDFIKRKRSSILYLLFVTFEGPFLIRVMDPRVSGLQSVIWRNLTLKLLRCVVMGGSIRRRREKIINSRHRPPVSSCQGGQPGKMCPHSISLSFNWRFGPHPSKRTIYQAPVVITTSQDFWEAGPYCEFRRRI